VSLMSFQPYRLDAIIDHVSSSDAAGQMHFGGEFVDPHNLGRWSVVNAGHIRRDSSCGDRR